MHNSLKSSGDQEDWLDDPAVTEILGMMVSATAPIAHLFRKVGVEIPRRVEAEQAYVLRWALKLARDNPTGWRKQASQEVDNILAQVKTGEAIRKDLGDAGIQT